MNTIQKSLIALAVIATVAGSAYNTTLSKKQTEMSILNLANITTLANAEKPNGEVDYRPCPNGCYDNGDGCYCYIWHPCFREAGDN